MPRELTEEQEHAFMDRLRKIRDDVHYRRSQAELVLSWPDDMERPFFRVRAHRPDTFTGDLEWGYGGRYVVDYGACESEIVSAIFGLFKSYEEHETREAFTYQGVRIYGPHLDVKMLVKYADQTEFRGDTDD